MDKLKRKLKRTHIMTRLEEVARAELQQAFSQTELLRQNEWDKKETIKSEIVSLNNTLLKQMGPGCSLNPVVYMETTRVISELEQQLDDCQEEINLLDQKLAELSEQLEQVAAKKKTLQRLSEKLETDKQHLITTMQYKAQDEFALQSYKGAD